MGKLLLAYLPDSQQRDLLAEIKPTKHGPKTITSKKGLRGELEKVRDAGFAVEDEELAAGLLRDRRAGPQRGRDVVAAVTSPPRAR